MLLWRIKARMNLSGLQLLSSNPHLANDFLAVNTWYRYLRTILIHLFYSGDTHLSVRVTVTFTRNFLTTIMIFLYNVIFNSYLNKVIFVYRTNTQGLWMGKTLWKVAYIVI